MSLMRMITFLVALTWLTTVHAGVVINEIFYHAPNDLTEVQWIELYNTDGQAVDISDWTLDKGKGFVFPKGTVIAGQGYLVVALSPDQFRKSYDAAAIGPLKRHLKRSGERLQLRDADNQGVDEVRYQDRQPWPVSADGYSASLERICPTAPGDIPENWAASPLPTMPKPAGTPGQRNFSYSVALPPAISSVSIAPTDPAPGQAIRVEAEVKDPHPLRQVTLLYRVVIQGVESNESAVDMTPDDAGGRYSASIPVQLPRTLLRYRIRAVSENGSSRLYPAANDLRPSLSTYVHEPWELGKLPLCLVINVPPEQMIMPGMVPPRIYRPSTLPSAVSQPGIVRPSTAPSSRVQPGMVMPTTAPSTMVQRGMVRPTTGPSGMYQPGANTARPVMPSRFGERLPSPVRGTSALVFVDQNSGKTSVFDYVNYVFTRNRIGHKLFFHKDNELNGMRAIKLLARRTERQMLAEALTLDFYRLAGSAVSRTQWVRVEVDGRLQGSQLLVEKINKSFLAQRDLRNDGNLYKVVWFGSGIVGQHQKKTNLNSGHEDVLDIINQLNKTKGQEQWQVIEKNFNVPQFANYYAVAIIVSDWDAYHNNYCAYHDIHGTGKWEIYPFDREKTWGFYDGVGPNEVLFNMPLTTGMEGDRPKALPPGATSRAYNGAFGAAPFGGIGSAWWRQGGVFSKPLLANPQFRKVFLARTRELLETVYTKEVFFPMIEDTVDRLRGELVLRGKARGEPAQFAVSRLDRTAQLLREHLLKRREFLLAQEELNTTGRGVPQDDKLAVEWYRKAADQGNASAQFVIGFMYAEGRGVPKDDKLAVEWWRKAADQGLAEGQYNLGVMYAKGRGVSKDDKLAVEWFRKAADQRNANAQYALGVMYAKGQGVSKDDKLAVEWYRKAAERGNADAQQNLGVMYDKGWGVPKDEKLAVECYRKAADQGLAEGQYNLGVMYAKGRGVSKDDKLAVEWYRKAADQGLAGAQHNLGVMYANGRGVSKDDKLAVEWFRKAADQGNANAQFNLGVTYAAGQGVPKDDKLAVEWWRKAADQGNADAQANLGMMYATGRGVSKDDKLAVEWYRKAADQGLAAGQINLAGMYFQGQGVPRDDKLAVEWNRKAADQGNAGGQNNLGLMYAEGRGVPRDDKLAVELIRKAVNQGLAAGQDSLGELYAKGQGVPKDDTLAVEWYRKAAEQGLADGQLNLGVMYAKGRGVSKDDMLAYMWVKLSADAGLKKAVDMRSDLEKRLTPEQIAEGKRLASEWSAKQKAK